MQQLAGATPSVAPDGDADARRKRRCDLSGLLGLYRARRVFWKPHSDGLGTLDDTTSKDRTGLIE
jgi:hypothetical protein